MNLRKKNIKQLVRELEFSINSDDFLYTRSLIDNLTSVSKKGLFDAKILYKDKQNAWVDIGFKNLFKVHLSELSEDESKVGNVIQVFIDDIDPYFCNYASASKALDEANWVKVKDIFNNKKTIKGIVENKIKGGYYIKLENLGIAFLPSSQVGFNKDIIDEEPIDIGHELEFLIINVNERNRNIIVSRKELISDKVRMINKEEMKTIHVGTVLEGVVKNIMPYGSFINLGYKDGLLHISDISWYRVDNIFDELSIGDNIKVIVTAVQDDGKRFSLGIKQITADPMKEFNCGDVVSIKNIRLDDNKIYCDVPCKINQNKFFNGCIQVDVDAIDNKEEFLNKLKDLQFSVLEIDTNLRLIKLSNDSLIQDSWDILENKIKQDINHEVFTLIEKDIDNLSIKVSFGNISCNIIYDEISLCDPRSFIKNVEIGSKLDCIITSFNKIKKNIKLSRRALEIPLEKKNILEFAKENVNKPVCCFVDRIIPEGIYILIGDKKYLSFINKYKIRSKKIVESDVIYPILIDVDANSFKFNLSLRRQKIVGSTSTKSTSDDGQKISISDLIDQSELGKLRKKLEDLDNKKE